MTEVLAVYAALVATASLSWQIYTWRKLNRVRVSVDADLAVYALPSLATSGEALRIGFKNEGGRPVTVAHVGGQYPHGEPWVLTPTEPPNALPLVVPAGEKHAVYVSRIERSPENGSIRRRSDDFLRSLPDETKMTLWVQLETGERFRSKPFTFSRGHDSLEHRAAGATRPDRGRARRRRRR